MNKHFGLCSVVLVALLALLPCAVFGAADEDMEYLGFSKDLRKMATDGIKKSHKAPESGQPAFGMGPEAGLDEADALQEQLTELGRSRSLTPQNDLTTDQVKDRLDEYWARMGVVNDRTAVNLSEAQKAALKDRMRTDLEALGYQVKQVDLIDIPANMGTPQVRAVVRVVRPMQTKDSYKEIQNNLIQVKEACLQAATVEGTLYLCELTTFIAENPRNNYYYAKTIFNP